MTSTPRLSLGIAILMMALGAPHAKADTTYRYTGNPFTYAEEDSGAGVGNFINASFTFASSLGVVPTLTEESLSVTSWSITWGMTTTFGSGSSSASLQNFYFDTDANGIPIDWSFFALYSPGPGFNFSVTSLGGPVVGTNSDQLELITTGGFGRAGNSDAPGTWAATQTGVPEPSTGVLISSAAALLLIASRRYKPQGRGQKSTR